MSHRIVVCWPASAIRSTGYVHLRALLDMANWCAERRLLPGPGAVAVIDSYQHLREVAAELAVPLGALGDAVQGTARQFPMKMSPWPLVAVAAQIRQLDGPSPTAARVIPGFAA